MNEIYPIGTIVKVKNDTLMITGYFMYNYNEGIKKYFDNFINF